MGESLAGIRRTLKLLLSVGRVSEKPYDMKVLFLRGIVIRFAWVPIVPLAVYQVAFANDDQSAFRIVLGSSSLERGLNAAFLATAFTSIIAFFTIFIFRGRPLTFPTGDNYYDIYKRLIYTDIAYLASIFLFMLSAFLMFMYANQAELDCSLFFPGIAIDKIPDAFRGGRYGQLITLAAFFGSLGIYLTIFGVKVRGAVQMDLLRANGLDGTDAASAQSLGAQEIMAHLEKRIRRRQMEVERLKLTNLGIMSLAFMFFGFGVFLFIEAAVSIPILQGFLDSHKKDLENLVAQTNRFAMVPCTAKAVITPLMGALQLSPFKAICVGAGVTSYSLIPLIWWAARRRTIIVGEEQLREVRIERDLRAYDFESNESWAESAKAEKLFRANQAQLQEYYDQNRQQNAGIFWIGIACIFISVLIVAFSIVMAGIYKESAWLVTILGAVGTIMTNVIAAIYLSMNKSITEAMNKFHQRLVRAHELFFANMVTSQIDTKVDEFKKIAQNVRAELAKEIVKNVGKDA
jgi:hypothetical protein